MRFQRWMLLVAMLAGGCGGGPCEQFYNGIYKTCGFGNPTQADIDRCNHGITDNEPCKNALLDLDYCATHLPNQCTYDSDCSQYFDFLKMYCDV